MKPIRVPRWILPATALSLALAGMVSLVAIEVEAVLDGGSPDAFGASAAQALSGTDQAGTDQAGTAQALDGTAGDSEREASDPRGRRAKQSTWQPDSRACASRRRARPTSAHDLGAPRASALVLSLSRASYVEQERILEDLIAKQPRQASHTLRELLAQGLPGSRYEAETLRLAILARVGRLDDPLAEQTLIDHIAPEKPRPQRLLALGLLAARPHYRSFDLDAIAREDHDAVVQAKARRLVGYQ